MVAEVVVVVVVAVVVAAAAAAEAVVASEGQPAVWNLVALRTPVPEGKTARD